MLSSSLATVSEWREAHFARELLAAISATTFLGGRAHPAPPATARTLKISVTPILPELHFSLRDTLT